MTDTAPGSAPAPGAIAPAAVAPPRPPFVSPEWLAARLDAPDVLAVDASWYLPTANRSGRAEFLAGHIPGAVFFDIDTVADTASGLPHMLPQPFDFARMVGALGIGDGMTLVVYDGDGLFSAARGWWTFRTMGARDVVILEGGLPAWKAAGLPLEDGEARRPPRTFTARLDHAVVADIAAVRRALAEGGARVVDGRPAARFRGDAPEPRPGLRAGHMPGAANVPFTEIVAEGRLKPPEELAAAFAAAGVDPTAPAVTSCGSGVSAAILLLALETLGNRRVTLYDGSWAEWGARDDTAVATGA